MPTATIVRAELTKTVPPIMYIRYVYPDGVPALTDSTSLIELDLMIPNPRDYLHIPVTEVVAPVDPPNVDIDLVTVAVSCDSNSFDFSLFDKNGVAPDLIDTIFEVCIYYDINRTMSDFYLEEFIIKNEDTPRTNKLYAWINNKDGVNATGPIDFILTYKFA